VKGKMEKISVIFVLLVLLGANMANLQLVRAAALKNSYRKPAADQVVGKRTEKSNAYELDYQILAEVSGFILSAAENNHFWFDSVVYSAALLFESEDVLIIIGHGHFDSKQQYYIGDFSAEKISQLALEKNTVALLACYSSVVKLQNQYQLSYKGKIDLKSSIVDLMISLKWQQQSNFLPEVNVILHDFDSGGGSADIPDFITGSIMAYNPSDNRYYNLESQNGLYYYYQYMKANLGHIVIVTLANEYYIQIDEHSYQLITKVTVFRTWITREMSFHSHDLEYFIHLNSFIINGESKSGSYVGEYPILYDLLISNSNVSRNGWLTPALVICGFVVTLGSRIAAIGAILYVSAITSEVITIVTIIEGVLYATAAFISGCIIVVGLAIIIAAIIAGIIMICVYYS